MLHDISIRTIMERMKVPRMFSCVTKLAERCRCESLNTPTFLTPTWFSSPAENYLRGSRLARGRFAFETLPVWPKIKMLPRRHVGILRLDWLV